MPAPNGYQDAAAGPESIFRNFRLNCEASTDVPVIVKATAQTNTTLTKKSFLDMTSSFFD